MIDYKDVSSGPAICYIAAVYNLPVVGKCAAQFTKKILELSEVEDHEEMMHVIGFSLGGQLAGQIAEHLKPIKLSRITGKKNCNLFVNLFFYFGLLCLNSRTWCLLT